MNRIPNILLMLNTKSNTGRNLLRGIGAFVANHSSWECNLTSVDQGDVDLARHAKVDGMIIQSNNDQLVKAASLRKIPVVGVGAIFPPKIPMAYVDPEPIGHLAANHLFERGFRRFAYCAYYQRPLSILRGKAFAQTLKSLGFSCQWFALPQQSKVHLRQEREQLAVWLESLPKPIGIFTVGDPMSRTLAIVCARAGIKVPQDVALLGVDNDELMCQMCKPELSSIEVGTANLGFEAGRLLQRLLDGQRVPRKTVLSPPMRIILRESTDIISSEDNRVATAVHFIQEKLGEGVNIKKLVDELDISRRTLERAFRQHLGRTIHEEISRAQLQRVSHLLEGSHLSLADIVAKCGMRHKSQLSNFVKKYTNMTPLEYRRKHQQRIHF